MPAEVLAVTVLVFAGALAALYGAIWLLGRFVHRYAALAAGGFLVAYMIYSAISGAIDCGAEPTYIAPTAGESGDGRMIFNCDGPGGASIYLSLFVLMPLVIAVLAVATYRIWRQPGLETRENTR